MRPVVVAVLLAVAVPTAWAQRPVTSPTGYGRILFPGGGPPGTGGTGGFGRVGNAGGIGPGSPVYPSNPIYPGNSGVLRPRPNLPNLPYYNFATVLPGTAWPTAGYPVSYPYVDGNYYGYE